MTNPTPDNAWNALDLPVLTDVVEADADTADVPVYDFTAELDALAQAVPADDVPELTLPPELSLDEVLGDDAERIDDGLSTSQLIERLPSLDLEVDLPAELSLDDVLPGLEPLRSVPAAAPDADFSFSLEEEVAPPAAGEGLSALFARASFEPMPAAAPVLSVPQAEPASVDSFAAQLDDFDVAADLPELPVDAFLSQADAQSPQAEVFSADSQDDTWAGTWEPPRSIEPPLLSADDLEHPPVLAVEIPALTDVLSDDEVQTAQNVPLAGQEVLPLAPVVTVAEAVLLMSEPGTAATLAPEANVPQAESESRFDALPWDVPAEPAPVLAANLALSVDDILASLQATPVTEAEVMPQAEPLAMPDAMASVLDAVADFDLPPAEAWLDTPESEAVTLVEAPAPATEAATETLAASWAPSPLSAVVAEDVVQEEAAAFQAAMQAARIPESPLVMPESSVPLPVAETPAAPVVQSISLDSLPTGVLGGGLGLAAAAAAPAATLGQPAAALPGGGEWQLPRPPAFDAGDKEVELAWARDLGAEPPLDLDELPPVPSAQVAPPVIAEVIRVRRTHPPLESPVVAKAEPAPVVSAPPVLDEGDIHIEAVGEALPLAPLATMAVPAAVKSGLDEEALIEALYARVLPRMKVELTLWMQDALEQQAKQLMAGVMKQLKEDFDMMLAESLRSSLREALDEASSKQEGSNE